ncbi:MAG: glycoside hydrolase family 127 protein [Clostridia bacterium]|nr:glycoside hydrolase family 127 protein [Clostridia bacterium]
MKMQTKPLPLRDVRVNDTFWLQEMELVRKEMIPYQWEALNDRVEGAAPSWCIHNFRAAARLQARRRLGEKICLPGWPGTFETLPRKGEAPHPDRFYGFLFQDSDLYKWLEAVSYSLVRCPDEELERTAAEAVELICQAQEDDGYLDTFYILQERKGAFGNLENNHELYCLGHLIEAAVAWHQATGREDLLRAACRFADCVMAHLGHGEGKIPGYPGHEIAEMALYRLFDETGEKKYREMADYFLSERGQHPNYFVREANTRRAEKGEAPADEDDEAEKQRIQYYQAHEPVREQREAVGHAVRAMYLYSGMADCARETGDQAMRDACERLWRSMADTKLYVTGGIGATVVGEAFSLPYDLPSDSAYAETCASVGLVFFARRMLQLCPRGEYADVMEMALNTVLSGMAMDGKSFFYVNPLEVDPEACRKDARLRHVKHVRQKWFGCACCPPNVARLLSSLSSYAFTSSEDLLMIHLYLGCEMEVKLGGGEMVLKVESSLPLEGRVRISVLSGEAYGTIALHLPRWCSSPRLDAGGRTFEIEGGYAYVDGPWKEGDTLVLELPMELQALVADVHVRELHDQVAFRFGPLTLCAEEVDNGKELHRLVIPKEAWKNPRLDVKKIGGMLLPVVQLDALFEVQSRPAGLYATYSEDLKALESRQVTLVPYFSWGNRGEGEMRVWMRYM